MRPRLLFVVDSDPRLSGRTAEAVRIAAGLRAGGRVEVTLYLHGEAVRALSEFPDELVDEENYRLYLPLLAADDRPVYLQRAAPALAELGATPVPCEEITVARLATLAAGCQSVLRF